jgi:hypothetical protein
MSGQHYAEPEAEGAARAAQLAAMSVTVLEAVARLRAQRTAERAEADERMAAATRAERIADHAAARVAWSPAYDSDWLRRASTEALGRVWAAAEPWSHTDPNAARAVERGVARLHVLHPEAMAAYQQRLANGADAATAMREAAPLFERPPAIGAAAAETDRAAEAWPYPRPPRVIAADGYPYPTADAVAATGRHRPTPAAGEAAARQPVERVTARR